MILIDNRDHDEQVSIDLDQNTIDFARRTKSGGVFQRTSKIKQLGSNPIYLMLDTTPQTVKIELIKK
jgi:ABC-type phosphonate transport system ATPase subunit